MIRPRGRQLRAVSVRLTRPLALAVVVALSAASSAHAQPDTAARFAALPDTTEITTPPVVIAAPSSTRGATMAGILIATDAWSRPSAGHRVWHVNTQTSWSQEPMVLLVLGSANRHGRQWLRVRLPIRPDGTSGWIPRNNVVLLHTRYWITVNEHARTVTVDRDGREIRRFRAVVGKPSTPTPTGLAAVYERDPQPDPTAFLGPWALPLTILSDALRSFEGGPGRVAIHGRDGLSLLNPLGTAASHGCIRIDNSPITWIAHHIAQGTPVQITEKRLS